MTHDPEVVKLGTPYHGGRLVVRCSCGYESEKVWNVDTAHAIRDRHTEIAPLIRGNACRYCFAPLDDPKAWYCGDGCMRADRVRPKADVLAAALEAHRVESFEPGPDQLSMFGEST